MNAAQFARTRDRIARESKTRKGYEVKAMRRLIREARALIVICGRSIIGWRLPDGAIVCHKRRYVTREAAVMDMLGIQAEYGKRGLPRRAYQCEFCSGFHLTSKISISED